MADEIVERLQSHLKSDVLEVRVPRARRIFLRVKTTSFKEAIRYAILELGFSHLSSITGIDLGGEIELIYHLAYRNATELSLIIRVPKGDALVPTISDLMPNSALYEREVHDLMGVRFDGLSDLSPLLLPDGWPKEIYPLRKEYTFSDLHEIKLKKS
ncbi:MAG: NADH-quinone oxidoreductase subunit C [Candidatus Methanomethylicaceae archaeon]|jgi:NADH:ubiquinone oxidoreductase subunit C